ncbi:tetratricopeptide repeat protein [Iodobacter fluviatilis]|uniref:Tetratricopeptide repeat protein n=1 Tax=Iodobacter fluviatilis TaxID=537 RepID=A0A377Q3C7_9NEIS|nr:hypothetical protein [Iodobacter fluviatilis]TCU90248.1 hypothetical protein EV682_101273 [Iodobacter fluviatilis]STQ89275.1 Uncharacterised protein [Iodobacter fluviatilis]
MQLPVNLLEVSIHNSWKYQAAFPPLGFVPFFENELGNGDTFGLYWPIGRENIEPIVAETWHDSWQVQPTYSTLSSFLAASQKAEEEYPKSPSIDEDPASPRALFYAAKESVRNQNVDSAIMLLEKATTVLPEYTDAQSLLWAQYVRVGRTAEATSIAIQAIISPPCFGARPHKALRWLCSQQETLFVEDDPIWQIRNKLKLVYGGTKENTDYPLLLTAIHQYLSQSHFVQAVTLMQTYAALLSSETVSFQERYSFESKEFSAWQVEVSSKLPHGSRYFQF